MILCKCGCGQEVRKENKYVHGHNFKGKKRPDMSKRLTGDNNPAKRPEVRKKLSGENNPNFGSKKRPWLEGDNHPMRKDENKLKLSIKLRGRKNYWMYGDKNPMAKKKNCEKVSRRMKHTQSGGGNNNWKGGISTAPYCEQWSDKEYKESIKDRDGYKCLNPACNKKYNKLCIHHINYNKKNCHPLNLITVCVSCNAIANKNRDWHEAWYKAIIYRRCSN